MLDTRCSRSGRLPYPVGGTSGTSLDPEIQEIRHTKVFVATTLVSFSIPPRRRDYVRQTAPAKSASAAKSLARPAKPPVVAHALAPVAAVAMRSASEETEVRRILERLRGAYERLDARAARQVWPSLDERRLARAFSTLKSQELDFEECRIDLASARGVALCRGRATYVGRFGKREPETQNRRWTFQVRKTGDSWAIDSVRSE